MRPFLCCARDCGLMPLCSTDTRTELVGGSEAYLPACRTCYNALHAARTSDAAQPQVAR